MNFSRLVCSLALLIAGLNHNPATAQPTTPQSGTEAFAGRWRDLALTKESEPGFRRFIEMAATGRLGNDVTNANVGVFKNHARVELVRGNAPKIVLFLMPPQTRGTHSRYFAIEPGPNATADDVARVGRGLDEAFRENPFELAYDFFNASPGGEPIPGPVEAYAADGWRGVASTLARHTVALASRTYTIIVIVVLATGMIANLLLLWGSPPPRARK